MKRITIISAVAAGVLFSAAGVRAAETAEANWAKSCATCHGKDGAAHTRIAKRIGVKDLTDAAYQKSFTDEQAFGNLKNGEKGKMSPMGDKFSDDEIKALVAYVRTLQK